ncbi:unnamed protein product, partial [Rotaria socialis]
MRLCHDFSIPLTCQWQQSIVLLSESQLKYQCVLVIHASWSTFFISAKVRDAPIPSPTNSIPILGLELVGIDWNWKWNWSELELELVWNWFRIGLELVGIGCNWNYSGA